MHRVLNKELNRDVIDLTNLCHPRNKYPGSSPPPLFHAHENGGEKLLCRQAEDAKDVASQADGAKDDHEDPNNPEPER